MLGGTERHECHRARWLVVKQVSSIRKTKGVSVMSKSLIGLGFCAIAAFLFASRYVVAAIFASGVTNLDAEIFSLSLRNAGSGLWRWAALALFVGVVLLAWDLFESRALRLEARNTRSSPQVAAQQ